MYTYLYFYNVFLFYENKTALAQRFLFAGIMMLIVADTQLHVTEKLKTNQFKI